MSITQAVSSKLSDAAKYVGGKGLKKVKDNAGTLASVGKKVGEEAAKFKLNTSNDPVLKSGQMFAEAGGIDTGSPLASVAQSGSQVTGQAKRQEEASQGNYDPTLNQSKNRTNTMDKPASLNLSARAKDRLKRVRNKMQSLAKTAQDNSGQMGQLGKALLMGAGTAAGAAGIGMGMQGGKKLIQKGQGEMAWRKIKQEAPQLADEEGREDFEVLLEYAPSLAKNPKVAMGYLERSRKAHVTPHEFVRELASTQKAIDSGKPQVDPQEAFGMGASMTKESSLQQELDELDPR